MLNPIQAHPTFDAAEIQRRLDAIQDQSLEYLLTLKPPTEENQKKLEELMRHNPEKDRKFYTMVVNRCFILPKIDVEFSNGFAAAAALPGKDKHLFLHPFLLINPNDLPNDLQWNGLDDSFNKDYVKRLMSWTCEKFNLTESQLGCRANFGELFQIYHKYIWKNPDKIEHVKNFILAHEVGHLSQPPHRNPSSWHFYVAIALTCCIAAILWVSTTPLSIIIGTIVTFQVSRFALKWFAYKFNGHKERELQADLAALKILKTVEGAEIVFDALHAQDEQEKKWGGWKLNVLIALFEPAAFINLTHPEPKERIAYLKEAQARANPLQIPMKA